MPNIAADKKLIMSKDGDTSRKFFKSTDVNVVRDPNRNIKNVTSMWSWFSRNDFPKTRYNEKQTMLNIIKASPMKALLEKLNDSIFCNIKTPPKEMINPKSLFLVKPSFLRNTASVRVKMAIRDVIIEALAELVNFNPVKIKYWGTVILINDSPKRVINVLKL